MMTVGKKMMTRNIAFVITLSLVSPYQPWPPLSRASASGTSVSSVTAAIVRLVMIRARRTAQAYLNLCGPDTLFSADRVQRLKQYLGVAGIRSPDIHVHERDLEHLGLGGLGEGTLPVGRDKLVP